MDWQHEVIGALAEIKLTMKWNMCRLLKQWALLAAGVCWNSNQVSKKNSYLKLERNVSSIGRSFKAHLISPENERVQYFSTTDVMQMQACFSLPVLLKTSHVSILAVEAAGVSEQISPILILKQQFNCTHNSLFTLPPFSTELSVQDQTLWACYWQLFDSK